MQHVLVVDDCADTRTLLERMLSPSYRVSIAEGISEARARLADDLPDLILLDLTLADGDGMRLCGALQNDECLRRIPIIVITASEATEDKVTAFSLGAEDYLVKPVEAAELRARIEARLRRCRDRSEASDTLVRGPLRIDRTCYRAFRRTSAGEENLELTPHEFRILHLLASREGRVISRAEILKAVWGDIVVSERTIDTHVSNLRRKLGPVQEILDSVRGVGYRLANPPVGPLGGASGPVKVS